MYRAGIDLGGTNIKAGIVDEQQHIIAEASVPTNVERPYQDIIRDMAELVKTLLKQKGIGETQLKSIGIGSPGTIDAVHGVVLYSNNFGWENVPLTEQLKKYFSCPIAVSNDANCAALGEVKAGAARNTKNAILLTLGTGVGGGIILDGKVFEGAHAGGAELGHTSLICGGEPCTCGRKGCVEAYVSATALIRDAKRAAQQHPESILNTMCQGDLSHMNGKIPGRVAVFLYLLKKDALSYTGVCTFLFSCTVYIHGTRKKRIKYTISMKKVVDKPRRNQYCIKERMQNITGKEAPL